MPIQGKKNKDKESKKEKTTQHKTEQHNTTRGNIRQHKTRQHQDETTPTRRDNDNRKDNHQREDTIVQSGWSVGLTSVAFDWIKYDVRAFCLMIVKGFFWFASFFFLFSFTSSFDFCGTAQRCSPLTTTT